MFTALFVNRLYPNTKLKVKILQSRKSGERVSQVEMEALGSWEA